MHIFFSAGEPSGDQHAGRLISELRRRETNLQVSGYGGPRMAQAGCKLHYCLTDLALMGLSWMKPKLFWRFYRLIRQAGEIFDHEPPDAVVLVNFSGFNWWIARKAKARGIRVFFYLPPQLWAWAPWRIRRVRRLIDHVLCAFPFEQKWYEERGAAAECVGHPFFDEVEEHALDQAILDEFTADGTRNVGVLPGSRNHEVENNFPLMLECMGRLAERFSDIRFVVACYSESHRSRCQQLLDDSNEHGRKLPMQLFVGKTPEIIQVADCCLMVSGSVSLELLARRTPAVVMYYANFWFAFFARLLVTCKYASLPNLIADREIMPEYFPQGDGLKEIEQVTAKLTTWLEDSRKLDAVRTELQQLHAEICHTGATTRTAEAVLRPLRQSAMSRAA